MCRNIAQRLRCEGEVRKGLLRLNNDRGRWEALGMMGGGFESVGL